jgi:hypothetical protein
MRRDIIEQVGFYNPEALHAEDYDLWVRASLITQLTNIPEVLLCYRVSGDNISSHHYLAQEQTCIKIINSIIAMHLGSEVPTNTVRNFFRTRHDPSLDEIDQVHNLIHQLYLEYLKANNLNHNEEREVAMVASIRLLGLALSTSSVSLYRSIFIFIKAIRFSPQLLFSQTVIMKGIKKFLNG